MNNISEVDVAGLELVEAGLDSCVSGGLGWCRLQAFDSANVVCPLSYGQVAPRKRIYERRDRWLKVMAPTILYEGEGLCI